MLDSATASAPWSQLFIGMIQVITFRLPVDVGLTYRYQMPGPRFFIFPRGSVSGQEMVYEPMLCLRRFYQLTSRVNAAGDFAWTGIRSLLSDLGQCAQGCRLRAR